MAIANTIVFKWVIPRAIREARASLPHVYAPGVAPSAIPSKYIAEGARSTLSGQLKEHGPVKRLRIESSYAQISGLPAVLVLDVQRDARFTEVAYFHGSRCTDIEIRRRK